MNATPRMSLQLQNFARDVYNGLRATPKQLASKYFYDAQGDQLFQDIMAMPEYYLTDCEREIFVRQRAAILAALGPQPFELVELGAGDGTKTQVLLEYFLEAGVDFSYRPIDISGHALSDLTQALARRWPQLAVAGEQGDYLTALERMTQTSNTRKVILFLGANIGNFTRDEAQTFMRQIADQLTEGDCVLVGFDLRKDPAIILRAYNDPAGITAAFNLNLLHRINRELGGEFDPTAFRHWQTYNPVTGEARSYLVSQYAQEVYVDHLGESFRFAPWEAIAVEVSRKYGPAEIAELASRAGMRVVKNFTDAHHYFVDSLWVR